MSFKDFDQVFEPLTLPIRGKNYVIPPVAAIDGIRVTQAVNPNRDKSVPPLGDAEYQRIFLGNVHQEMLDARVPDPAIALALRTAFADWRYGRHIAETIWEQGLTSPKALNPTLEAAQETIPSTPSPSTDAENATPSPASSSGTRSRKKSPAA